MTPSYKIKQHYHYLLVIILVFVYPIFPNSIHIDTEKTNTQSNTKHNPIIWHMSRQLNHVALTFDDGPDNIITPQILDILNKKNIKATFFIVGHMVKKHPMIVQKIHHNGHHIANHSWAHYRLDEMNSTQINRQISSTIDTIKNLNVDIQPYFRPPGGRYNNLVIDAAKKQSQTIVMWDVNAADYTKLNGTSLSQQQITHRVISKIKPGSIVLMHNSINTVASLPIIIDKLHNMGYTIGLIQ